MPQLDEQINKLNFSVELSMRYHQRRRAFFERNHNIIMFFIIVLGSAAFSSIFDDWQRLLTAGVALLAAGDLVWKPSHRSRDHEVLFRRFSHLAADLRTGESNEANYRRWKKERIEIELDEPPVYRALANDCHNEVTLLADKSSDLVCITPWYKLTMHWLQHSTVTFQEGKSST